MKVQASAGEIDDELLRLVRCLIFGRKRGVRECVSVCLCVGAWCSTCVADDGIMLVPAYMLCICCPRYV